MNSFFGLVVIAFLGFSACACNFAVTDTESTTDTSNGGSGGDDTTTVDNSGGSGGSDTSGSGGATTTTDTGSGGSDDCSDVEVDFSPGDLFPTGIMASGMGAGLNVLFGIPEDASTLKVTSATICQTDPNGDVADFNGVFMSYNGQAFMTGQTPDGSCWTLMPSGNAFELTPGDMKQVWAGGVSAQVVSSAAADGAWYGVARSGHTPVLQLKDITVSRLDGSCTTQMDVGLSGEQMVLRKARPIVEFVPIQEPLHTGLNTIAKVRISSDPGYTIALRQLTLHFQPSPELTVDVDGINPWMVDDNEYADSDCIGVHAPLGFAQFCRADGDQYIPFSQAALFTTFDLRVNVSGVVSGSSIKTEFFQYAGEEGHPNLSIFAMNGGPGALGFLVGLVSGTPNWQTQSSGLLWSDLSEDPHTSSIPTSYDVFTRNLVPVINEFSLVTAP